MHNQSLTDSHQQTDAQPVSEQQLLWKDTLHHQTRVCIAEHDGTWHGISF